MEITLEKVDQVRERTGVSYAKAKEALVKAEGDVLEAIILLEEENDTAKEDNKKTETVDELKVWLKDLINKGNVARIKVSKDEKVLVDVPVNAGIAAGVIGIIIPPILAFVVVAAVVTQVTIEITKTDGTVEVVNKYIAKTVKDVKEKAVDLSEKVKEKIDDFNSDNIRSKKNTKDDDEINENTFTYTVKFDDDDKEDK